MYVCVFYEPLFLQSYCPLAHDDKEHLGHQGQTLVQGGDLGFSFGEWELGLCWDSSSQSSLALTFCKSLEQSSWFLIQVLGACPPAAFLPFLSPPPGSPACPHPNQPLRPNPISSCTHLPLSHTHPALHAISTTLCHHAISTTDCPRDNSASSPLGLHWGCCTLWSQAEKRAWRSSDMLNGKARAVLTLCSLLGSGLVLFAQAVPP